jgi:hypothetical protein
MDTSETTEVMVITRNHRIMGRIALVPGARLTDYIREPTQFIAMTQVVVCDQGGKELFSTPFLDLGKHHIEIILPKELARFP